MPSPADGGLGRSPLSAGLPTPFLAYISPQDLSSIGRSRLDFTVAIPSHNGADRLPALLERLRVQRGTEPWQWEVIVCDNNSSDATAEVVRKLQQAWSQPAPQPDSRALVPLRYCFAPEQGAAFARQRLVEAAAGHWIGFLDDDNWPAPDWVAQALAFAQAHPQAGAIGSRIRAHWLVDSSQPGLASPPLGAKEFAPFLAIIERGDQPHRYDRSVKVLPPGAGLVVQRQAWLAAVPARLCLNHAGRGAGVASEDLEAVLYLRRAGWELWHNPAMVLDHALSPQRVTLDALLPLFRAVGQSRYHIRLLGLAPWQRPLGWPLFVPLYWAHDLLQLLRSLLAHLLQPGSASEPITQLRRRCDRSYRLSSLQSPLFLSQRALGQFSQRWLDRWRCPNRAQVLKALGQAVEAQQSSPPPANPTPRNQPTVCFVIPSHNRRDCLLQLLQQLTAQMAQAPGAEQWAIVVVDDGSGDGTAAAIAAQFPQVAIHRGDGHLWWMGCIVAGMGWAIAQVNPDFFVWLNDDLQLDDDFVQQLVKLCHQPNASHQVVGGIVCAQAHPQWIVYSGLKQGRPIHHWDGSSDSPMAMDTLAGNVLLLPRAILNRVGFPDAIRFPQNGGDYAYSQRIRQAGFAIRLSPRLRAKVDYGIPDLIRYMPYWMQWLTQPSPKARLGILSGLLSLKANQNIWMFVHLREQKPTARPAPPVADLAIPAWRYACCYGAKLLKLGWVSLIPRSRLRAQIEQYLDQRGVPAPLRLLLPQWQSG